MSLNFEHIVVDVEGIYLDGVMINTDAVKPDVVVNHGGGDEASPSITLTIKGDLITVSDRLKAFATENPGSLTEVGGTDGSPLDRVTAYLDSAEREYGEAIQPFHIDECGSQLQHKLALADLRQVVSQLGR